ncbi:hypothetical protein quinque_008877 [Culex quinquefasciatus]
MWPPSRKFDGPVMEVHGDSLQGPHEKRLLNNLLATYNTLERPVANESESLEVKFGLTLQQIIDVDEKNQLLITNIWLSLEWNDYNLRWNDSEFGGVRDLRITPNKLWKPDVLMYNSADEGFDGTYHTNIVVRNNGSCFWTYDGNQLDLVLNSEDGGDLSDFITNGEWYLIAYRPYWTILVFKKRVQTGVLFRVNYKNSAKCVPKQQQSTSDPKMHQTISGSASTSSSCPCLLVE